MTAFNRVSHAVQVPDAVHVIPAIPGAGKAYTTGQAIGGTTILDNPVQGIISDYTLKLQVATALQLDILLFSISPGATWVADGATPAASLMSGGGTATIPVATTDWVTYGPEQIATITSRAIYRKQIAAVVIITRTSVTLSAGQFMLTLNMGRTR